MKNKNYIILEKKKKVKPEKEGKKIKPRKINPASHDSGRVASLECQAITFLHRLPLPSYYSSVSSSSSRSSSYSASSKYVRNIGNNLRIPSCHTLSPFFVFYGIFLSFPISPNSQEIRPYAFYRRNKR